MNNSSKKYHEKWLKRRGLSPKQIKQVLSEKSVFSFSISKKSPSVTSDVIPENGTKSVDMSKSKFSNNNFIIAPTYNKGSYAVIPLNELTTMGKK